MNARTETGQTVLHFVQDPRLAKFLIENGADVNARDYDFEMTPIYFHKVAIAKLLHKAGADVNARAKKGITPLMWYTYSNYVDGLKFLIANGAQINIVNGEGSTGPRYRPAFRTQGVSRIPQVRRRKNGRRAG